MARLRVPIFDRNFQIVRHWRGAIEEICEMDDFTIARAAFDAAATVIPESRIVLKNGARIIETVTTGPYDHASRSVPLISRET